MKLSQAGTLLLAGTVACSLAGTRPVATATPSVPAGSPTATATPGEDVCHAGGVTYCALNPAVTQATIGGTICTPGWTATIRPPASYTSALKRHQMITWGLTGPASAYEEDHRMPLELGGAPKDPMNLTPEPGASAKDSLETSLKTAVCDRHLSLVDAQTQMRDRWLGPYPTYRA